MCTHLIMISSICKILMKNNKQNKVFITMYLYYLLHTLYHIENYYIVSHTKSQCYIADYVLQKIGTKYLFKICICFKENKNST